MSRKFEPRPGFTVQAYRFALDPTEQQAQALRSNCGGQRFVYNWGLARVKANLAQRKQERSDGVPEDQLTPSLSWSAYSLRKTWNATKDEVAPWWAENSKEAYSSGLANLADGLSNWKSSKDGQRNGPKARFPRFKSAKRSTWSATFTTGAFGLVNADRRHVQLPTIGTVRTYESTRKLARRTEAGAARILKATISHRRGRWFVSLQAEVQRDQPQPAPRGGTVVEDLNIAGMTRNRRLARHIADAGMGELRRQLDYKTRWNSRHLVVADRWYPSSKTCNDCGAVKTKLRLSERTFQCDSCGMSRDRDYNAALNLADLMDEVMGGASSQSCRATENEPAEDPRQTSPAGSGYRHGKATPDGAAKAA